MTRFALRDLARPEHLSDPYPLYGSLLAAERADDPRRLDHRVLTRHADVSAVLRDPTWSSDRIPQLVASLPENSPLDEDIVATLRTQLPFADPPAHTRIRQLVQRAFTPRTVATMEAQVEATTSMLMERFAAQVADGEPVDFVGEVAYPLPVLVLTELLGVPPEDRDEFKRWATTIATFVGAARRDASHAAEVTDVVRSAGAFLRRLARARRNEDFDDLFGALVAMADDGDRLSEHELVANYLFLLVAGHETATNHLANALVTLLRHPDELARLRSDRALLAPMVEETLRFESPVQSTARIALADREVAGRAVRAGQSVVLVLGAANRDPEVFDQPDRFDVGRTPNRHVAFSAGVHFCLGAALARMEALAVFGALLDRVPSLALVTDEIAWQPTIGFRGPTKLEVVRA
jgi:pimeloyl-[acyl-carrier protein] synthase